MRKKSPQLPKIYYDRAVISTIIRRLLLAPSTDKVANCLASIPMPDLHLRERCSIVNTIGYSLVYYLDRFTPAPPAALSWLKEIALKTVWWNQRAHLLPVQYKYLCHPTKLGGFGLHHLLVLLDGPRAERVWHLFFDPSHVAFTQLRAALHIKANHLQPWASQCYDSEQRCRIMTCWRWPVLREQEATSWWWRHGHGRSLVAGDFSFSSLCVEEKGPRYV
jgi:hypothetical protein